MFTTIISTNELFENLSRLDWVLLDCRFDLSNPSWGYQDYLVSHIPGAVYADVNKHLSGTAHPTSGRHPLPNPTDFASQLNAWGINPSSQVVVYDTSYGAFASRAWFLMKLNGHNNVALLDGGFNKWLREYRPVFSATHANQSTSFPLPDILHFELTASAQEILNSLHNPAFSLIDARSKERFSGTVEPIDSIAGHIPGALNRFYGDNLNQDGTLKTPTQLFKEFSALLNGNSAQNAVVYCGSGVTACLHLIALEHAGLYGARLYPGSWSHWIKDPERPVATGLDE